MSHDPLRWARRPLFAFGGLGLLLALWAGLLRIGWALPTPRANLAVLHGPLMIAGFFGVVIGLERAAALGRRAAYLAPALAALSGMALLLGASQPIPQILALLSALTLSTVFAILIRTHTNLPMLIMAGGALAWAAGNLAWLLGSPPQYPSLWWAAFLILTIAGERLELGRLLNLPRSAIVAFAGASGLLVTGAIVATLGLADSTRLVGGGAVGLALWLLRYDIARRTVRKTGLTRYIAVCMLGGYIWLGIGGAIIAAAGLPPAGLIYDAALHALFVGFVFAMIFGHAPIIFPALLSLEIPFRPILYLPLTLLHASLVLRIAGDLAGWGLARSWGGLLNVLVIILFLALMIGGSIAARRIGDNNERKHRDGRLREPGRPGHDPV